MEINIKIVEKRNQEDIVRLIDAGISLKNTNKSQVILTELYPEYLKSDNMPSCDEITIPASNEENEEGVRVIEKFSITCLSTQYHKHFSPITRYIDDNEGKERYYMDSDIFRFHFHYIMQKFLIEMEKDIDYLMLFVDFSKFHVDYGYLEKILAIVGDLILSSNYIKTYVSVDIIGLVDTLKQENEDFDTNDFFDENIGRKKKNKKGKKK